VSVLVLANMVHAICSGGFLKTLIVQVGVDPEPEAEPEVEEAEIEEEVDDESSAGAGAAYLVPEEVRFWCREGRE
jgi:hypothetical protein